MITYHDIEVVRGDTFTRRLVFFTPTVNQSGVTVNVPVDITGRLFFLTVKRRDTDTDDQAAASTLTYMHDDAPGGLSHVTLTATQTYNLLNDYQWDIQEVFPDGTVVTIIKGTISFVADETRRTS